MNQADTFTAPACPVAALLPELAAIIDQQNHLRSADCVDVEQIRPLAARQAAIEAMAETSQAASLAGASLQIMLSASAAADMGAELIGRRTADTDVDAVHLDRTAEATARSAYAALSLHGGGLAEVIVENYWPTDLEALIAA